MIYLSTLVWCGHCQVLCLSLHRRGVSQPTMWVVFPGFGPTATLKPNLKLRGSTSPCRLLRKDDYPENQFCKDHLRLIFMSSSCVKTVPPAFAQSEWTQWHRGSHAQCQYYSAIPIFHWKNKKGYELRKRFHEHLDACPEWECPREATATRILWQNLEGLAESSDVQTCCCKVNNPHSPSANRKPRGKGHKELRHLVCKESLVLWGWAGVSTSSLYVVLDGQLKASPFVDKHYDDQYKTTTRLLSTW